jgi:hypothetical protein
VIKLNVAKTSTDTARKLHLFAGVSPDNLTDRAWLPARSNEIDRSD